MADVIKIPYGLVIATSDKEWAMITGAIKMMLSLYENTEDREREDEEELEKLLLDLLTPRDSYGSEGTH